MSCSPIALTTLYSLSTVVCIRYANWGTELNPITRRASPLLYITISLCSELPLRGTPTPFLRGFIVAWRALPRLRRRRGHLRGKLPPLRSRRLRRQHCGRRVDKPLSAKRVVRVKLLGMPPLPFRFAREYLSGLVLMNIVNPRLLPLKVPHRLLSVSLASSSLLRLL